MTHLSVQLSAECIDQQAYFLAQYLTSMMCLRRTFDSHDEEVKGNLSLGSLWLANGVTLEVSDDPLEKKKEVLMSDEMHKVCSYLAHTKQKNCSAFTTCQIVYLNRGAAFPYLAF